VILLVVLPAAVPDVTTTAGGRRFRCTAIDMSDNDIVSI
jgi:hypothetical protein